MINTDKYHWKVVPICDKQKRDIAPDKLLNNGLFRKCDVYKGGGGYDIQELAHHPVNTRVMI